MPALCRTPSPHCGQSRADGPGGRHGAEAINQGDALLHYHVTAALVWKIPLTCAVPYLVWTYGALSISRIHI
jgi:hypothetical protein